MDNNFENNTPENNADVKPETTYTDPNAGATYTYGAVPKPESVNNTAKEETADAEYRQPEPTESPSDADYQQPEPGSGNPDAGYQQPKSNNHTADTGYYQQPTSDYGSSYAGGQQNQGYTQTNTGHQGAGYTQPNTGYQQDYQYQNNYNNNQNSNYQNPGTDGMDYTPLSMGEWLLTLLAALIPCGGLILYCIWAFSKTGNIHRRNFCRASLILQVISVVISIVFVIFIALAGISSYSYY